MKEWRYYKTSSVNNYMNTGLISQNYDVINTVTKKYAGNTSEKLQEKSSGTMRKMSDEEVREMQQKQQNQSRTLSVDRSEVVDNVFSKTGDNITYEIDGVTFTNAQMKACKEVVRNAISALPAKGSDLDYKDYASMGIATNMVSSYAKENLTEEQAAVINKSMEEYINSLTQAQKERQNSQGYFTDEQEGVGNTGNLNTYYNTRMKLSDKAADSLKIQMANLPEQTRKTLMANLEGATQRGSVVQSASNKELSSTIKTLFQNVDMKDEKALNATMKQYRELMTPVYQASGIRNTANNNSLTNVLDQDISRFVKQIANANAVTGNVGSTFNDTI